MNKRFIIREILKTISRLSLHTFTDLNSVLLNTQINADICGHMRIEFFKNRIFSVPYRCMPKKSSFRQKICGLPKVWFGRRKSSVRENVDAHTVNIIFQPKYQTHQIMELNKKYDLYLNKKVGKIFEQFLFDKND
jgi:hypothetical protein